MTCARSPFNCGRCCRRVLALRYASFCLRCSLLLAVARGMMVMMIIIMMLMLSPRVATEAMLARSIAIVAPRADVRLDCPLAVFVWPFCC